MQRFVLVLLVAFLVAPAPALAWTWPVDGPVVVPFNFGADPYLGGQHRGIDVGAPTGTPVVAPAGGTVTFAGAVPGGGKTMAIRTADDYSVTLVHLGSVDVAKGVTVKEGDVVGSVGPSGTPDIADPYVYMGVRVASDPQGYFDPLSFLPPRTALSTTSASPADAVSVTASAPSMVAAPSDAATPAPSDAVAPALVEAITDSVIPSVEPPAASVEVLSPSVASDIAAASDGLIAEEPALAEPPGGSAIETLLSAGQSTPVAEPSSVTAAEAGPVDAALPSSLPVGGPPAQVDPLSQPLIPTQAEAAPAGAEPTSEPAATVPASESVVTPDPAPAASVHFDSQTAAATVPASESVVTPDPAPAASVHLDSETAATAAATEAVTAVAASPVNGTAAEAPTERTTSETVSPEPVAPGPTVDRDKAPDPVASIVSEATSSEAEPATNGVELPVPAEAPAVKASPAVGVGTVGAGTVTNAAPVVGLSTAVPAELPNATSDAVSASQPKPVMALQPDLAPAAGADEVSVARDARSGGAPTPPEAAPAAVAAANGPARSPGATLPALRVVEADAERLLSPASGVEVRRHGRPPLLILVFAPLAFAGALLAARLGRRRRPQLAAGIGEEPVRMMESDVRLTTVERDLRGTGVALRERPSPHRPCRRIRRAGGHPRALPPAQRRPRLDGERDGRARYAGDGRRRRRGGVPA